MQTRGRRAERRPASSHNTLVVFTSDNGFLHGEHRLFRCKRHIYEESIRVPLEMRGPGIPEGVSVDDLSINADLAPTIVDVGGRDPRRGHGRALADPGRPRRPVSSEGASS